MNSKDWKRKVIQSVQNRRNTPEGKRSALQRAIPYDTDLRLSTETANQLNDLLNNLFSKSELTKKHTQKLLDLEILIANVIRTKRFVHVSMNSKDWVQSKYNKSSQFAREKLIPRMTTKKYIDMEEGYYNKENPKESRRTRIRATEKLLKCFEKLPDMVLYQPSEIVILKKGKKPIEYKDTIETHRIRAILEKANRMNQEADISYKHYKVNPVLRAVFIDNFSSYGRIHTKGYYHHKRNNVQKLSGEERNEILINGNPITELDFSALHPSLLYAEIGIQIKKDPYTSADKRKPLRPLLKNILLCMLNSKSRKDAELAANRYLREKFDQNIRYENEVYSVKELMDKMELAHSEILHFFYSGKKTGLRVMNKDATIALEIIKYFTEKNIPIIPIHDSFIVEHQHKEKLRAKMHETYQKHTGGYTCKIK